MSGRSFLVLSSRLFHDLQPGPTSKFLIEISSPKPSLQPSGFEARRHLQGTRPAIVPALRYPIPARRGPPGTAPPVTTDATHCGLFAAHHRIGDACTQNLVANGPMQFDLLPGSPPPSSPQVAQVSTGIERLSLPILCVHDRNHVH